MRTLLLVPLLAALLATQLAGCGGGSDDGGPTSTTGGTGGTATEALDLCGNATTISAMVNRINAERATARTCGARGSFAATGPLAWNAKLAQAASAHSVDMATQNYFSHTAPGGGTVATRVTATGYDWNRVGENIAAGYRSIDSVINGWLASDGHCANIMNPNYTEYGFACAFNSASDYDTYWTQVFARPQ